MRRSVGEQVELLLEIEVALMQNNRCRSNRHGPTDAHEKNERAVQIPCNGSREFYCPSTSGMKIPCVVSAVAAMDANLKY